MNEKPDDAETASHPPTENDPVSQSIETIVEIHSRAEKGVDRHQRAIEHFTAILGRPLCLYLILIVAGIWIGDNLADRMYRKTPWDAPPFYWLQGLIGLSALLTTIVVLITQNRMGKMAESRARLDLQISLLIEQKVTKVIELLEELRIDMPSVRNRHDPTAVAMAQPANPSQVMDAIEVRLENAISEALEESSDVTEASEAGIPNQTPS